MVTKNNAEPREDEVPSLPRGKATIQERTAAFVMLDAMPAATTQAQKTLRLWLVGFTNPEIAAMLQTTPATVSQNLYEARKRASDKKPRRKPSTPDGV